MPPRRNGRNGGMPPRRNERNGGMPPRMNDLVGRDQRQNDGEPPELVLLYIPTQ